jgi:hypothetical protein
VALAWEGEMAFWVVRAGKHGENEAYAVEQQIGGEPFRDRRADALGGASHDRHLACQLAHVNSPVLPTFR